MPFPSNSSYDVIVVGSGNAGFSAAVAARHAGAQKVILIDKCPADWAGGNTYFTAGAYRTVHAGKGDLLPLVPNVDAATAERIDMEPYTDQDFTDDIRRVCSGRSDPELSRILVTDSNDTIKWLARDVGVRFHLSFNRQAYEVDGRLKFWGGLALKTIDGGKSLIQDLQRSAARHGVEVHYSTPLTGISIDPTSGGVSSVTIQHGGTERKIECRSVILAAGGFESNPRMRSQYLGPGWDLAKVRGTPFNTGDVLELAMRDVSAKQAGNWSGCHSVAWDFNTANDVGDREASNEFTKSGYPLGLMLNVNGERFVDEGIDLRNFTYAKFGRAILNQPNRMAFQLWDSRTAGMLREEEYREARVKRITAESIADLADMLVRIGLQNPTAFVATVEEYNRAVYDFQRENPRKKFDPSIRDGMSTQSMKSQLRLSKSNWALPLDKPPFLAVQVTCGITFTFGGLQVVPATAQLVSAATGVGIPGLFCVGEMLGGLFYENYPGGSGLTSGAVFGRRAGKAAAKHAHSQGQGHSKL